MQVTLADTMIEVTDWTSDLDYLGEFKLKLRKTPDEMRAERKLRKDRYGDEPIKINPIRYIAQTVIMKDPQNPSRAYFLPGLWSRIKAALDAKGRSYSIVDKRNKAIRPELDVSAFKGVQFRMNQDVLIATIAMSECGIIDTPTGMGKSFCIALLCKALPSLNIVVTTSSAQVVATLYEYISKVIPGQVGVLYAQRNTSIGKRVVITTLKSLPNIKPDHVDLVFVDECHSIGCNQAGEALTKFCFARKFGFSASPVRNDGSGLMMEAILGPVIFKMEYQDAVDASIVTPMKYLLLPVSNCPTLAKNPNLPEFMLKRMSYWCNDSRNEAIAKFVYDLKKTYSGQILIIVSTLEHAIRLHQKLPWFKVAYGGSDLRDVASKFPRERYPNLNISQYKLDGKHLDIMRNAFAKGTLRYIISTKTFRQGVNFVHLSCLIRADGDVSSIEGIQIPGRLSRLDDNKEFAYLVDMDDMFSVWAHNRSIARRALYDKQKWIQIAYGDLLNELRDNARSIFGGSSGSLQQIDGGIQPDTGESDKS